MPCSVPHFRTPCPTSVHPGVTEEWIGRYPGIVAKYALNGVTVVPGMRIGLAVPAAGLGFSVVIFAANALVCIGLLAVPHGRSNPWQSSCLPPLACHLLLVKICWCHNMLVSRA